MIDLTSEHSNNCDDAISEQLVARSARHFPNKLSFLHLSPGGRAVATGTGLGLKESKREITIHNREQVYKWCDVKNKLSPALTLSLFPRITLLAPLRRALIVCVCILLVIISLPTLSLSQFCTFFNHAVIVTRYRKIFFHAIHAFCFFAQ